VIMRDPEPVTCFAEACMDVHPSLISFNEAFVNAQTKLQSQLIVGKCQFQATTHQNTRMIAGNRP
jgi:hypothetical protein